MYTRVKRDRPKIKRDMYGVPIHDEDDMNTGESSEDTTGGRQLHTHSPSVPPSLPSSVPICRETLQTNFSHQRLAEKAFLLTETLCRPGNLCEWWIRCLLGVNLNLSVGKDAFCWEKNSSVR